MSEKMLLPSGRIVDRYTPIYSGSNFTWGEATAKLTRSLQHLFIDGKLIYTAVDIERNIIIPFPHVKM